MATKKIDWLIVTEKPDQARRFEEALSLDNAATPYLEGVVEIVHARGRLYDFAKPEVQNIARYGRELEKPKSTFSISNDKSYKSDRERLANMPVLLNTRPDGSMKYAYNDNDAAHLGDEIVRAMLNAKHIVVATDWDIEGELVFNDLVTVHQLAKSLNWDEVYRVHIVSLDKDSLLEALSQKQAYGTPTGSNIPDIERMVSQGYARSIADYEFGYTFSFYNEMLKRQLDLQFEGGLGRLKLSVLNAILEQENNVLKQDLRQKYVIKLQLPGGVALTLNNSYFTEQDAQAEIGHLPKTVTVTAQSDDRKMLAPELYTRTSYIIDMDRHHDALNWGTNLQSAYETYSAVSYPRTASSLIGLREFNRLRDLVTAESVLELLTQRVLARGYEGLAFNKLKPRHKYVAQTMPKGMAHHAIIPTRWLSPVDVDLMETHGDKRTYEVYLQVLYHTMAMFAENGIDEGQLLIVTDDEHSEIGRRVLINTKELGWRKLIDGPVFDETFYDGPTGSGVPVTYVIEPEEKEPLQAFDHAGLLSFMNAHNMGTESTREPVINDLKYMRMIELDDDRRYHINDSVAEVLKVIRLDDWVDFPSLNHWDKALDNIHNMHDAMGFIQTQRNDLERINEKVVRWYDSNQ